MSLATAPSTTVAKPVQSQAQRRLSDAISGYGFVLPAFLILFFFLIVPMFVSFYYSLTDWDGLTPLARGLITEENPNGAYNIVGFSNYQRLLINDGIRQKSFFTALKNTIYYVVGVVPVQTVLALILAVIVNQRWLKGKGFFRTAFYFPSITSSVVISLIFLWMFSTSGLINQFISSVFPTYTPLNWFNNSNGVLHSILGVFGITRASLGDAAGTRIASVTLWDWLSGPSVAMFTIMILNTWTTIGTMMVIYLSALQNIPGQVYEAAFVDGANAWAIFRKITVPLLAPTTFFIITIGLIGAFQVFDQVKVISNGGPNDTTLTISYLVYNSAFEDRRMGFGAATAIILFVVIFLFTLIQRRFISDRNKF